MSETICPTCKKCDMHGEEPGSISYCPGNSARCEIYQAVVPVYAELAQALKGIQWLKEQANEYVRQIQQTHRPFPWKSIGEYNDEELRRLYLVLTTIDAHCPKPHSNPKCNGNCGECWFGAVDYEMSARRPHINMI